MFVFSKPFYANKTSELQRIASEAQTMLAYATIFENGLKTISVIFPNGSVVNRHLSPTADKLTLWRLCLKDMLVVNTTFGRIGLIAGREMHKPEFFTAEDTDLLVTFGNTEYDERCGIAYKTASLVSQVTGSSRFHASGYYVTFALNSIGEYVMQDDFISDNISAKEYQVRVDRKILGYCGIVYMVSAYMSVIAFIAVVICIFDPTKLIVKIIMNLLPKLEEKPK